MVCHYSKLQYPYQISLSKCKMKRVLRRFLNSLRTEQFDVVVDLTSSPVPTRTNVPTNYIRTSFPYFNKSTSFYSFFNLVRFLIHMTLFTAALCSNVFASENNSWPVMIQFTLIKSGSIQSRDVFSDHVIAKISKFHVIVILCLLNWLFLHFVFV